MMRILHVCSELYPLLKTGGLADVAAALPPAQVRAGGDARVLLPGFPAIRAGACRASKWSRRWKAASALPQSPCCAEHCPTAA